MISTINSLYGSLGYTIGSHPVFFLALSFSFFCLSLLGPIIRLEIKMDMKSGFTHHNTASMREVDAHKRFFNNTGEPWYMALFATANNGSILEASKVDELTTFYKYITQIMSIGDGDEIIHYRDDLCEPFCDFNSQLWNLLNYQSFFKIHYPLSTAGPYKVNIGKHIFNRTINERGIVVGFGTAAMYFTTFFADNTKKQQLNIFEEQVLKEVHNHNANPNNTLSFVLHGAHTISSEVRRGIQIVLPYYLSGAFLLLIFIILCYILLSTHTFQSKQLIFVFAAIISPLLAALSAVGLILLIGYHVNVFILISPFITLAMGIGIDNAFLMANTWLRQLPVAIACNLTPPERLRLVLEKVGIGITITSLTNALGFALGCIAPAPEIQLFCGVVALSMLIGLLFELFFYAPFFVIFAYHDPTAMYQQIRKNTPLALEKLKKRITHFCAWYAKFITSIWAEFAAAILLFIYLYESIVAIQGLNTNLDAKMLLPPNSQSAEGIRIMNDMVWPDYLSINYIIYNPPNFSNNAEYDNFLQTVEVMESAPNSLGPAATMFWVKDYLRYLANPSASKLDVFFGISGVEVNDTAYRKNGLDMSQFDLFIDTEPYTAWKAGVRYEHDSKNRTLIKSMMLMIGYNGVKSFSDKAKLLCKCRETCSRYPQYDMIPFDTDAELVDIILSVPSTTYHTILLTAGAMGFVFFLFSLNVTLSIIATLSVASICVGVIGFLQCDLDPLIMVAIMMTACLSVDYTAHILFHYLINDDNNDNSSERISASFQTCALPMIVASFSTFLIMFPVLFAPVGIYALISKAILLVVLFGLIHDLFFIPVLLTALPNSFTRSCLKCC